MTPKIHATTAQFPGYTFEEACDEISKGIVEGFGRVDMEHVQLCPQAADFVDENCISVLQQKYPDSKFRLHANVRVDGALRILDASRYSQKNKWYYERLAELSKKMSATGYSLHAGYREDASLEQMKQNALEIQSFFPCEVMVEGMYPDDRKDWLIQNWTEYQWLLESDLLYAIDLSHLNIVQKRMEFYDRELVKALLLHPNCREIHLSYNHGNHDSHLQLKEKVYTTSWWKDIWLEAMKERLDTKQNMPIHFTEGRVMTRPPQKRKIQRQNQQM